MITDSNQPKSAPSRTNLRAGRPQSKSSVDTSRDSVQHGSTTIEFEVRRSRRRKKTLQLKLTDDGEVRVLVPWDTSPDWVRKCVLEHAQWIVEQKAKAAQRPRLRFVTGEILPFMGRNLTLHVTPADSDTATARRVGPEYVPDDEWPQGWMVGTRLDTPRDLGRLEITSPRHLEEPGRAAEVRRAICAWYYDQAGEWLPYAVKSWLPDFNRKRMPPVSIGNQRSQWGQLLPGRSAPFHLARDDAGPGSHRLHRHPRARSPQDQAPSQDLLGRCHPRSRRNQVHPRAPQRSRPHAAALAVDTLVAKRTWPCACRPTL